MKKFNTLGKIKKIALMTMGVIVAVVAIIIFAIYILRCSGKKSLYGERTNKGMIFESDSIKMIENKKNNIEVNGKKYRYNEDILTFLILGIDKNEKVHKAKDGVSGGQSDGIFLVVMNPDTKKVDVIVLHRDTVAEIQVYNREGEYVKDEEAQICLQHAYGDGLQLSNNRAKDAISKLFCNLPIHSVTSVNMGVIGQLNDAIGGVTLESLESFTVDGYVFEKGDNITLMGQSAYYYTKYRDTNEHYTAGKRLDRQKQYLEKAAQQLIKSLKENAEVLVDIYNITDDYVITDLSINELTYLGTEISGYTIGNIYTPSGKVDTTMAFERFNLDIEEFEKMIVNIFFEEVE